MHNLRKSIIVIVTILCIMLTQMPMNVLAAGSFSDVPEDHWGKQIIESAIEEGYIVGYPDGTFKPDRYLTRAEFMTIVNKIFNFTESSPISYPDVKPGAWYWQIIETAKAAGYLSGYPDGTIKADNPITREEAFSIIMRLMNLAPDENGVSKFSDADKFTWSKGAIGSLVNAGIVQGYPDGSFQPQRLITRTEVLVALNKAHAGTIGPIIDTPAAVVKISTISGITVPVANQTPVKTVTATNEYTATISWLPADTVFVAGKKYTAIISITPNPGYTLTSVPADFFSVAGATTSNAADSGVVTAMFPATHSTTGGGNGGGGGGNPTVNTAPSTPVITKTPSGNVSPTDPVTITATSTDAEGDSITYLWEGRLAETSVYPIGKHVITVKAVDEHGLESQQAAIVFFVTSSGSGGVLLTSPNSRIYENGIDGATITAFTFNVPSVSGHWGDDKAWVRGLNVNTQEWEYIPNVSGTTDGVDISGNPINIYNGVYLQAVMTPGTYSRLEFFYYASHCMYGQSNITYTVDYTFGAQAPGVPEEAAPTATNVVINGTGNVGVTLSGAYDYNDANGDLEGYVDANGDVYSDSIYQWYRADDSSGTNISAIAGADALNYTITISDAGKYLTFEVTPRAVTGVTGTITGNPVGSSQLYVVSTDVSVAGVTVDGVDATVDGGDATIYDVELPSGTVLADLTAADIVVTATDAGATVAAATTSDGGVTWEVAITAGDGMTTENYTINVTVAALSTDVSVAGVTVDGVDATVDGGDATIYDVELPSGTVLADLTAADIVVTATDAGATVAAATTSDGGVTWEVAITAGDGTTTENYTINVTVAV